MPTAIFTLLFWFSGLAGAQDLSSLTPQNLSNPTLSFEHQDAQIDEQKFTIGIPVYRGGESALALTAKAQRVDLGRKFVFPSSQRLIPDEFGSADIGLSWSHEDSAGNKFGLSATYGEAGTRLFGGGHSAILSATAIMERKKEDHSWIYFLNYSNNRTFWNNIPIPGFAYLINRTTYTALIGLPFGFISWRPDPWMMSAMISPFGGSIEPGYRFWGPLVGFTSINWSPRSYPNVVKGSDERLLYDKKEAGAGVRMMLGRKGSVSLGYVFAFGRKLMIGQSIRDKGNESYDVKDTSGLQLKAKYTF